jgi:DNA-binding NarL/FixJ family response regulator
MTLDGRTRELLVDDHPLVRVGLARLIDAEPALMVCGQAGSLAEVAPLVRAVDPDVAVLDLMLRGCSGLELLKALLGEFPHLRVLVLSMHDQRVYAERCIKAGARGYLMKEEAADLVIAALRTVAEGGVFLSPSLAAAGAQGRAPIERLSDREMRIFELVGEGLPTRVIAARLALSDKTVEAHKAHIKDKLGIGSAAELAKLAITWRETGER